MLCLLNTMNDTYHLVIVSVCLCVAGELCADGHADHRLFPHPAAEPGGVVVHRAARGAVSRT